MMIQPSGNNYATGETCEWITEYSPTHGFALHVLAHDDYAQLELITRGSDDGGIIDMSADELDALAAVLAGIAARIRSRV